MTAKLSAAELKPGPEMDRLVAIHVMGWTDVKFMGKTYWGFHGPGPHAGEMSIPGYSTSDAAALEVLKELAKQGYHVEISTFFNSEYFGIRPHHWLCRIHGNALIVYGANSIAHAICGAALEAKGVVE